MQPKSSEASQTSSLVLYKRLLRYAIPLWPMFALGVFGYVLFGYSQAALASLMGDIVDAINEQDSSARIAIPLTVIGIFLYRGFGSFIGEYGFSRVAFGVVHQLRTDLFDKLVEMPNDYFDQHSSGAMISRITFDVMQVMQAITDALKVFIREGLIVLMLLGYLLWENWKITLIFIAIAPIVAALASIIGKRLRKLSRRIQTSMGNITHISSEMINNIKTVRIFSGETYEKTRFEQASKTNYRQNMKSTVTQALGTPVMQFVIAIALSFVVFLALTFLDAETPGAFIAYVTAAGLIPKSVRQLAGVISKIQKGVAAAESIFGQLDTASEIDTGHLTVTRTRGDIQIQSLSFQYPSSDEPVLRDIHLNVDAGQTVALVGRSGSGKTTLVSLLPRFYSEYSGSLLIDGVDIRDYTLASLRQQIAFVGQNITLFNDTIANNIAYGGLAGADESIIIKAAKQAHAWEFIERLPQGLQTLIGENGARLSGGQRQRLAIARALLKDAPILILDEATSALDNESERAIQTALDEVMKNRTTLVVAHRLSTIENADKIVVMDAGQVLEEGTHRELIAKQGYYAQLHSHQFSLD